MSSLVLPNLLLIGAGKAGSTLIWDILNRHPAIEMSRVKEPSFFSDDSKWAKGLAWYQTNFALPPGKAVRYLGEASNSYSAIGFHPNTIERISSVLTDVKIIYTVRNPCRRVESDWMEASLNPAFQQSFSSFIRTNKLSAAKSDYLANYQAYANAFGPHNIHVVFFEDLIADPATTLGSLYAFLNLSPSEQLTQRSPEPKGQTSGAVRPPSWLRKIRSSSAYNQIASRIPGPIRKAVFNVIGARQDVSRPSWSEEDMSFFTNRFYGKSMQFLTLFGKESSFWPFTSTRSIPERI
jgi:hypothetical protein